MKFDFSVLKSQKGAFLVLVAILIPVFLLLASLAVDLGKVWAYHSKLQNAADAAARLGLHTLMVVTKLKLVLIPLIIQMQMIQPKSIYR